MKSEVKVTATSKRLGNTGLQQSNHPTQPFKQEKIIIQNQKYKCKNNTTLIYLSFVHCTCKFEKQITELN